ncbi:cholinesterase-like [Pecten maximus]|uniref:cholinesterase-like n=1 Tax=Pecten maximus TaxID=6579 RepID=UPI0014590805|nr:cholinesterase-like [Pecten maximus]
MKDYMSILFVSDYSENMMVYKANWLPLVAVFVSVANGVTYKTVRTPSGPVRGIAIQNRNQSVYQYRNIPYAKPPVGNLRLKKPVPFGSWTNVLDATSFGPSCMQDPKYISNILENRQMSEDCLQLNVYTPCNASLTNKKSVMIWIHGGGYIFGQGTIYDASPLTNVGDVIVVTVNYRLGLLGFLSTMDDASLGNYGLWDQRLAVQWVKQNIAAFGGDPNSITLFGESAGSMSVALHALNPQTMDYSNALSVKVDLPILLYEQDLSKNNRSPLHTFQTSWRGSRYVGEMVMFNRVLLLVMFYLSVSRSQKYRMINSPSGSVRGIGVHNQGEIVYQYRKIPFAKPPVGNLRLRKPVPFGKWTNVLDGTSFGPSCYQPAEYLSHLPNMELSEDCLQLNIYTPSSASPNNTKSVMVWIHGGGYVEGHAIAYDGTNLANTGDVVVVTVNYRLGIFGFLSTMDNASRGNYGLWDQRLAMQWVKDNIEAFGGDPNSITIFGESAGAFSVGLHAIIPENRGLFQRVIAESGTGNSPYAINHEPTKYARGYGVYLKCLNENDVTFDTEMLIQCIRGKNAQEIMQAQINLDRLKYVNYIFNEPNAPVVDGELIKQNPSSAIANSSSTESSFFRSLDAIIGNTDSEGSLVYDEFMISLQKQYSFNYSRSIPTSVLCNSYAPEIAKDFYISNTEVSAAICKQYSSDIEIDQSRNIVNMYSDFSMIAPAVKALNCHSLPGLTMGRSTYQYIFSREYTFDAFPQPNWFKGAWHGAEVPYLFGPTILWSITNLGSRSDSILSEKMIKYWTNFAKNGSPNGPGVPYWPRYDSVGKLYQNLNINISPAYHLYPERMRFWNQYLPSLVRQPASMVLG